MREALQTALRTQRWQVASLAVLILLFSAWRFDGPAAGYWDTYISVPAIFMNGVPVELTRQDGSPRFDYALQGSLPEDTFDPSPGGFGIASKDQRIGAAILFGAPFSLLNMAAFRWGFAATWVFLFLFGYLAGRRILGEHRAALAGALLLVANPFSLYLDRLNGNLIGLAVLVFLFFLLLDESPQWWLIGLIYGLCGGIRNEAIILGPVFLGFLWLRRRGTRDLFVSFATFFLAALTTILPVLMWNRYAYGQMIIHPSQVAHLQGFRPTFPHRFLGSTFEFNGLLNWPFHDRLVRTPHFGYPTALLWPLVTIRSLGLVLVALVIPGAVALWRRNRAVAGALLYWYLIVYALFVVQENWEELKQTFMALHLFPLAIFVAAGGAWLASGWRRMARWGVVLGTAGALALGLLALRTVELPEDTRWYVRFPHAATNDAGLERLSQERRKDWHFFYTREAPGEADAERSRMTSPSPLPQLYRPFNRPADGAWGRILDEAGETHLRTLAVWSYIYE
jgi:hypothetical protein